MAVLAQRTAEPIMDGEQLMMRKKDSGSFEVLHLFLVPSQLSGSESRPCVGFIDLVERIRVVVRCISPQKLPFIVLRPETKIRRILPVKILRVDFFDEAQKRHSPRIIIMIPRNAIKQYFPLGLQSQLPDETSNIVLVLLWSTSVVNISEVQNHVDSLTNHHVLEQLIAVL